MKQQSEQQHQARSTQVGNGCQQNCVGPPGSISAQEIAHPPRERRGQAERQGSELGVHVHNESVTATERRRPRQSAKSLVPDGRSQTTVAWEIFPCCAPSPSCGTTNAVCLILSVWKFAWIRLRRRSPPSRVGPIASNCAVISRKAESLPELA